MTISQKYSVGFWSGMFPGHANGQKILNDLWLVAWRNIIDGDHLIDQCVYIVPVVFLPTLRNILLFLEARSTVKLYQKFRQSAPDHLSYMNPCTDMAKTWIKKLNNSNLPVTFHERCIWNIDGWSAFKSAPQTIFSAGEHITRLEEKQKLSKGKWVNGRYLS